MSLPISSISAVCRSIADFISTGLEASSHSIRVLIGNPIDALPGQSDTDHRINLFFYRLEPSGFFPDSDPGGTWWVRLHCLITGFGVSEEQISCGENDLRLIGEVVRLFHENPILNTLQVGDETFRMQVVFQPLTPDDLNHIWSTQGDVNYRPSVVYEMALAPVIPRERTPAAPLVGAIGSTVAGTMAARTAPFSGDITTPPVVPIQVDDSRIDWAPAICFLYQGNCTKSLAFADGSPELAAFSPSVWVAGAVGSSVNLVWECWTAEAGWVRQPGSIAAVPTTDKIDPELSSTAVPVAAPWPLTAGSVGQAMLYAERTYQRLPGGPLLTVRSNPLLVTVYEATP